VGAEKEHVCHPTVTTLAGATRAYTSVNILPLGVIATANVNVMARQEWLGVISSSVTVEICGLLHLIYPAGGYVGALEAHDWYRSRSGIC
jgi:hypothetical protein